MTIDISLVLLHFSLIDDIGPATIDRLVLYFGSANLAQLYDAGASELKQAGISSPTCQKVISGLANSSLLAKELQLIERAGIRWTTYLSDDYPDALKNIYLPPAVLYWKGILPSKDKILAIVGSRDASIYAQKAIDRFVPSLVQYGWAIASGGARGADTMAHSATLKAGGTTLAILGSGLLHYYPVQNKYLFNDIIEKGGALISPFNVQMQPLAGNFPARNRIISGLSRGCLVVQAAAKSGARITAEFSLQQGKEVFAIPGIFDDQLSQGCHQLIQQGAKLVTNPEEVLIEFGQVPETTITLNSSKTTLLSTEVPIKQSIDETVMSHCKHPCSVDDLIEATQIPFNELSIVLFDLQLQGKITQNMSGLWEKQ